MASSFSSRSMLAILFLVLSLFRVSLAKTTYIQTTDDDGQTIYLADDRRPALYTGNYGDCLGTSNINVTRFDAAYYKDNMTVLFHLAGNTALKNESLMMYIGVYAYGESRFDLTFNPCAANIYSMCPMKAGVPIEANGIIPVSQSDVGSFPSIALTIPDFEGEAILRIFANSTQSEIGCFSAVVTNGATFSQPAAVGSVLGIFTAIAILASFATAIYGDNIPVIRTHYAHSLSILVVFAVLQHIFFSGALSMNWPSVLVAFWSNYAWAGGMIHTEAMQNSINKFIGSNKGNTSHVGAAGTGVENESLGGGYDISKIYKRDMYKATLNVPGLMKRAKFNRVARALENTLAKRELANSTDGFKWYGHPVKPGLPLPGNYSGFAGTLAQESIPASNAFMTGFLWYLILIAIVAFSVVAFKWILEGMSRTKLIKNDRLMFFRTHWLGYTALAVLRTLFIGFFMMMFLCLFQFTYLASAGPVAIAAIVFLIMFVGILGLAGYACFYRVRIGNYVSKPDRLNVEKRKVMKVIPWYGFTRASSNFNDSKTYAGSLPWWSISPASAESKSIHEDEDFTKKFGWLASRFRRTRWWFFAVWLVYEFIRACFLAGASGHPLVQVFGLLVVEFIAFIAIVIMRPFEGQRLNALVVYVLGFSKVATVALSAAFDISFNLARIPTTVIGVVIIVIQGILTIVLLIAIVVGAISSYMSVMRNREEFKPKRWAPIREKYFKHLDRVQHDVPRPPPPPPQVPEEPKGPYFSVNSIKRMPKIEDEDKEFQSEINASQFSLDRQVDQPAEPESSARPRTRVSRTNSVRSQMSFTSLPHGARVHRPSWSSRDFSEFYAPQHQRNNSSGILLGSSSKLPTLDTQMSQESLPHAASPVSPFEHTVPNPSKSPVSRPRTRPGEVSASSSRPKLPTVMSQQGVPVTHQERPSEEGA